MRDRFIALAIMAALVFATVVCITQLSYGQPFEEPQEPHSKILFTHPSWLKWWTLPNLEVAKLSDEPLPITGVWCVYVETASGNDSVRWHPEVYRRSKALGLTFVAGMRHSHQSRDDWSLPFDLEWQGRGHQELYALNADGHGIDAEPYYSGGRRYHGHGDMDQLLMAAQPWRRKHPGQFWVYPADPRLAYPMAILHQAVRAGTLTFAADHTTYDPSKHEHFDQYLIRRAETWNAFGARYAPGLFLRELRNPETMRAVAPYGTVWFFPRTTPEHPDDLPHFGQAAWDPD